MGNRNNSNIIERNNKIINLRYIFLINLILIGITYSIMVRQHFSNDTYINMLNSHPAINLQTGRPISYIVMEFFVEILKLNPAVHQELFTIIFILATAICSTVLYKLILNNLDSIDIMTQIVTLLIINLTFINVYILEFYLFPEGILLFTVGLITVTISIQFIVGDLSIKNIIISFIFLFISLNTYQIYISFFIIYSLTIILIKNEFRMNKNSIKCFACIFANGFIASILNILLLYIFEYYGIATKNSRSIVLTLESLFNHFKVLFKNVQAEIWIKGSGFMPNGLMLIFLLLGLSLLLYTVYKIKLNTVGKILILLVLIINYCINFVPHIITDSIWTAPRTITGIFAFLSAIFLLVIKLNKNRVVNKIIVFAIAIFIAVNYYQIQSITINHVSSNKIDKEIITMINNYVCRYEKENNIEVKKVAIGHDINPTYGYYGNVNYILYDTNLRALVVSWADIYAINYYTGRDLIKVEMDEEIYNEYFKDKDWTYFDPAEQMVFYNDTLYLMVY